MRFGSWQIDDSTDMAKCLRFARYVARQAGVRVSAPRLRTETARCALVKRLDARGYLSGGVYGDTFIAPGHVVLLTHALECPVLDREPSDPYWLAVLHEIAHAVGKRASPSDERTLLEEAESTTWLRAVLRTWGLRGTTIDKVHAGWNISHGVGYARLRGAMIPMPPAQRGVIKAVAELDPAPYADLLEKT